MVKKYTSHRPIYIIDNTLTLYIESGFGNMQAHLTKKKKKKRVLKCYRFIIIIDLISLSVLVILISSLSSASSSSPINFFFKFLDSI
jgi:hypothetical protein